LREAINALAIQKSEGESASDVPEVAFSAAAEDAKEAQGEQDEAEEGEDDESDLDDDTAYLNQISEQENPNPSPGKVKYISP